MAARTRRPRGLSANHVNEEERLQTIMNDKSILSSVRLLGKENWVKMEERPNCFYCARKFRPFSIKRHCRSCGEIVCSNCYRRRRVRVTPTLEVTVRLCFDCIDKAMLLAESENINASAPVMEQSESNEEEEETQEIALETCKPEGKKTHRDSLQTTSTSTSFCSRFSDFSGCDNWSDADSDASDTSSLGGSGGPTIPASQRGSRRGQPIIPATDMIEFLPEHEQFEIYEARRHEILTQFKVLDTEPEKEYDAVCELVRQVLECNVAAVAFMDQTRQWYKARYGIAQAELPREIAFCSQLLQTPLPTIVMDATKDPRFNQNPLVTGSANIRFYATTPICDPSTGIVIGSVFVMDPKPKQKLPLRSMEVLSYASSAAEKLLIGEGSVPVPPAMKQKRHKRRESMPSFPEIRAASLQSVPEEIEDGDFRITQPRSNASSVSSNGSVRSSKRGSLRRSGPKTPSSAPNSQPRYQLLDPNVKLTSSKASNTTNSKLCITDLVSAEPGNIAVAQQAAPAQLQSLDSSCIELFHRITSTQQLLAQQHDTLLATLTQHSSRISSIEQTVDRIEGILSAQRTQSMPQLVDSRRRPVDM
ncbi:1-phosphatidylinositol 3-phosphate 5-kinase FAB1 [Phytophthora nicotianae]|uniref:1-phosphatidylinositol 3-phosphate 5-kinase FAB1 n=1 Tax=Phytophthora nicotianae TaxID=4792 RepID=A0A0W8CI64_PHYNI|nr:1-phosphatidylinositol 3-phosphate 5-kinase FAB1 [Phytophthora nicotianae]